MTDAISIALTGLRAQNQRLAVAANNIANANTTGVLPTQQSPASTVYKPLSVSQIALAAGGVITTVNESPAGYSPAYDPSNIYANEQGVVAAPNVDLPQEIVNILETKSLFKANLAVLKTQNEMLGDLIDTLT